jgi:signal transduction histidine kinase
MLHVANLYVICYNKQMTKKQTLSARVVSSPKFVNYMSIVLLAVSAIITVAITVFLYGYTSNLLSERLYERLNSVAATAALLLDGDAMNELIDIGGEESLKLESYRDTVMQLQRIKDVNKDITFAYIYGKTDDINTVKFVADADVIALRPDLNFNEDEVTDEGFPGSTFDVSEIPLLTENTAFEETIVDTYFYDTIWGRLMTTYAPIFDSDGIARATLAIDVDITDFNRLVKTTFVPFGLCIILLLVLISMMTLTLVRTWGTKVNFLNELDRQKDELLGIVSHQLATPVSSIKWYLEMMLDGDVGELSKEQAEHVESLQFSAANLADLVSMILDVSRIQLGRMKVDRTDIEPTKFFNEEAKGMAAKAKEQGVKLVTDIQEDMPVAMLDMRLMRMTMENLLSNAIKYTPKDGSVTLKAAVKGNHIEYSVTDTGCGIPASDHDKIFGKLFRASNVGKIDGNGFGLYVAKGAVEAQGGTISFTTKEGKGTTFTVKLPVVTQKEEEKK